MTAESSDEENKIDKGHHLPWASDGTYMLVMSNST